MPEDADDGGSTPITASYIVKYVLPMAALLISGVGWGARLESKAEQHEQDIIELKVAIANESVTTGLLKVEQAKLNGQIETLRVMLSAVAETAKRIEDKLDRPK